MSAATDTLRFGTLGSSATFAGEAAAELRTRIHGLSETVYFPTIDECWAGLASRNIDVLLLSVERTGALHHHGAPILAHGFYVMTEMALPLGCGLYVKPGASKGKIREITGHGSIAQCTAFLDREFPGLPRQPHGKNSVEAARMVMAGDGSMAVVGSASLPTLVPGLQLLSPSIDDGAICNWWAITTEPHYIKRPATVIVSARLDGMGAFDMLVRTIHGAGFGLGIAAPYAVREKISVYDYLLTFRGSGELAAVQGALNAVPGARLLGAFTAI